MQLSLSALVEATLYASGEALTKKRITALLEISEQELQSVLAELDTQLLGRGLTLIQTDTDVELRTASEAAWLVKKLRESELSRDLGKAGLEALGIILYQNGATRGQIDWVRGVNSAAAVRSLLLRGLVERVDDPADKRRAKYLPTVDALAHLGVASVEQLPEYATYARMLDEHAAADATEPLHAAE